MTLEGQRLGEFEIIERVGQGGMGAVYRAVQSSLQRTVAIKTLDPSLAGDPEYIERFHREAIAAASLCHQNLVQVYAAGESEGLHWFAMEFVRGESAYARLKRKGCIEPGEAIALAVHLANALDYAWKRAHLIHRDIKPDNIFLSGEGDVKLGDLGLAKMADQSQALTVAGASMGTPHHVSPEQAEGKKDVDLRADIYSLGCTLYHLVSGQTPFSGDNAVTVMTKHVTVPPPDIRGVFPACPRVLAEVIFKMMQKDPAARQQSHEEVDADLRRAYEALGGTAGPVPVARGGGEKERDKERRLSAAGAGGGRAAESRRSLRWAVAAVAACMAAGALVYFAPWKNGGAGGAAEGVAGDRSVALQSRGGDGATKSIPPTGARSSGELRSATKDKPFINTLGMKFVPVPGTNALFCIWETRVRDYAAYARGNKVNAAWATQQKDGVPVGREPDHPVCGVNWEDVHGFCTWLTEKEIAEGKLPKGIRYRLPTDEEWSRAVGLASERGRTPAEKSGKNGVDFPWGIDWPPKAKVGNYADTAYHEKFPNKKAGDEDDPEAENDPKAKNWIEGYTDGFATTAPVGSFAPNEYGIHDLGGNVWEWVEDWYDGSNKDRVLRGASWNYSDRTTLLSSYRSHGVPAHRSHSNGFRVVMGESSAP